MSHSFLRPKTAVPFLTLSLIFILSCSEASQEPENEHPTRIVAASEEGKPQSLPEDLKSGEKKFNDNCARCHGVEGKGTSNGPPLVHKIYEPNHHGDFAFQRAAAQGVRAHHWQFGNMPKIGGVTSEDVTEIIQYVRWLQRQAGIY